jgi:DNA-binding protein HU-beta
MANKQQLADRIAEKLQLGKKSEGILVVDTFIEAITESLAAEGSVQLAGFGVLRIQERGARKGINPATRDAIDIPARKTVVFRAGKILKGTMNAEAPKAAKKVAVKKVAAKK